MSYVKALELEDLAVGTAVGVEIDGEPICLVRVDETTVKAIHDVCSHEEYPLSEGWVEDTTVECALHGSTFSLETGEPETLPAVTPVPVYACRIEQGAIEVDPARQLNDASVPRH